MAACRPAAAAAAAAAVAAEAAAAVAAAAVAAVAAIAAASRHSSLSRSQRAFVYYVSGRRLMPPRCDPDHKTDHKTFVRPHVRT